MNILSQNLWEKKAVINLCTTIFIKKILNERYTSNIKYRITVVFQSCPVKLTEICLYCHTQIYLEQQFMDHEYRKCDTTVAWYKNWKETIKKYFFEYNKK